MTISRSIIVVAFLLCLLYSCGDDSEEEVCATVESINRLLSQSASDVNLALDTFLQNQTDVNCNNLRIAYAARIDELEGILDCADMIDQGGLIRTAINESSDAVAALPCG